MILGIDVGGTHTDAVLIENFQVKRKAKVPTDEENLLESLLAATTAVFREEDPQKLRRVVLSTTASTNAIVQGRIDPVGMVLVAGPGLPPPLLPLPEYAHVIAGCVNHRGTVVADISSTEVARIQSHWAANHIRHAGIVGKFSPRNPAQENTIAQLLGDRMDHVSLGHRLSGHLNFPRRIATTYLNAAVWRRYANFVTQIQRFVEQRGITAPIYILKADGGTAEITQSRDFPVQTILSGPAASIMGVLATADCTEDAVALDIGGTTTDIALFADGVPLLEAFGVAIEGHKTLIRGLRTKSIGVGGDSCVSVRDNRLAIGPVREGLAAALGGPCPTPTDAMVVLEKTALGDPRKAVDALAPLSRDLGCSVQETAAAVFEETCGIIARHVNAFLEEVNNQPVYTIHELLEGKRIAPKAVYVVGGPAGPLSGRLGELLGCPAMIPGDAEVANAVGAALARTTAELTLLADTEQRTLTIAEEGAVLPIGPGFRAKDAIRIGTERLHAKARQMGAVEQEPAIEVVECQEFPMVREFSPVGKNIRVKLQVKPGLINGAGAGGTA